ncbi:MAG TPA: hypothetical protein VKY89_16550 [Thermoanaerobaculia bacterium]|nr:hypothetical protein [Thermoanaerobaculia bacterium]
MRSSAASSGDDHDDAGGPAPLRTWQRAAAVALPLAAAAAALAVSWQRWIDPLVDSGREMDVPWRLLQGERLYADVTYYYGPLGPWTNALALRLLGSRWLTLELMCAALSAAIFLLLFRLTRRAGGNLSATVATTLAAALCMAAPRGGAFIFPYSSSGLFALAGGLLALDATAAVASGSPWRRQLLGALGLGIALASRFEIGAAAAVTLVLAGLRSRRRQETRADLAVVAGGAVLACGAYAVAFAGISWSRLLADGPLSPYLGMPPEWRTLYLEISGLSQPLTAAGRLGVSLLLDGLLLAAAAWLALPEPGRPRRRYLFAAGGLLLLGAYLWSPWNVSLKNLPPLLSILPPAALAAALILLRRPLADRQRARFLLFFFSAAVAARVFFGLVVGPRMGPISALPLPGLLATGAVLAFDVMAPRTPAPASFRRRLAAIGAVVGVLFLYRLARFDDQPRRVRLATAAGCLRLAAPEARAIAETLDYLDLRARDGDTLTAFPESGFFNFVTGLRSPLRQDLIVPGVLRGAREEDAARQLADAGPRFVLLCNRPTREFGPEAFGRDYAVRLWSGVAAHYRLAAAFGPGGGASPVGVKDFFVRLYERSPAAGAPVRLAALGRRPPAGPDASLADSDRGPGR